MGNREERYDILEGIEDLGELTEKERIAVQVEDDETPVECRRFFKFLCRKVWQEMETTDDPMVHYCTSCERNVYLCASKVEAEKHRGECIALVSKTRPGHMYAGEI